MPGVRQLLAGCQLFLRPAICVSSLPACACARQPVCKGSTCFTIICAEGHAPCHWWMGNHEANAKSCKRVLASITFELLSMLHMQLQGAMRGPCLQQVDVQNMPLQADGERLRMIN